ncbi:mitochondrial metalloendopeptidase OMA1 [Triticum aestivum]|uniref:mitochondrial metalloendopeptidase OMA1 n=1 Tax=Triticum aestivum TaxID=4565 RepID=UPI001D009313|nr:mitochondrial metalloendopeptidase OMA1-like [Triticum aestivum]
MNFMRNSRSVFSRLQTVRRYSNPAQPQPARPRVLDSVRGLFSGHAKPVAASQTVTQAQPQEAGLFFPWGLIFFFLTCDREKVPCTNRAHWVFLSPSCHTLMGNIMFEKIEEKRGPAILGPFDPNTVRVRQIASGIIRAAHNLFPCGDDDHDDGQEKAERHDFKWEVVIVNDDKAKAYSLPNGKIVVYTGLLNCLKTDAEIAALIAHEAAHVVANHDMEFSRILPFYDTLASQRNEMEADLIGMKLLAAAGFDTHIAHGGYETLGEIGGNWWSRFHPWCKKE